MVEAMGSHRLSVLVLIARWWIYSLSLFVRKKELLGSLSEGLQKGTEHCRAGGEGESDTEEEDSLQRRLRSSLRVKLRVFLVILRSSLL